MAELLDEYVVNRFCRGGSRPKNPGRIRDGSTIRIRHGIVFLFPAIREQYVRTYNL
jgi:hypothetical protein